ncbi:ADP-ribosylglycohydrolase family protein [Steroidobacter flavus]|uniref:ADP-ribosylglycohydrolase family protein n=1 Tax=Steroidobacter flavus TaxID=1842136 RepID=A0ABV8SPG2_9GAMM
MESMSLNARYRGALVGLACGDAVGTTVEFMPRGTFPPVTDMVGGGPFVLKAGQWTDDTSMALCLAESLLYRKGFDATDQMNRYCNWWQHGYLSSTGECFDIGNATRAALQRYLQTRDPFSGATDPRSGGNGSLMRLAPVVLFFFNDPAACLHFAEASSRTTHAAPEPVECCRVLAQALIAILRGVPRNELLSHAGEGIHEPKVVGILARDYQSTTGAEIRGSGYCIDSLAAALWSFLTTEDFESAILRAVNLGDDADTTAAICGQLAGAYYGVEGIPRAWRMRLAMAEYIDETAQRLFASCAAATRHP